MANVTALVTVIGKESFGGPAIDVDGALTEVGTGVSTKVTTTFDGGTAVGVGGAENSLPTPAPTMPCCVEGAAVGIEVGTTGVAVGGTLVGGTLVGGTLVGGTLVGGTLVGGTLVGDATPLWRSGVAVAVAIGGTRGCDATWSGATWPSAVAVAVAVATAGPPAGRVLVDVGCEP